MRPINKYFSTLRACFFKNISYDKIWKCVTFWIQISQCAYIVKKINETNTWCIITKSVKSPSLPQCDQSTSILSTLRACFFKNISKDRIWKCGTFWSQISQCAYTYSEENQWDQSTNTWCIITKSVKSPSVPRWDQSTNILSTLKACFFKNISQDKIWKYGTFWSQISQCA